ncbi:Retrovirus-related Pol polyprotein from type-1 retrotransposable element R2 [Eumeta japonica]|uniref:Retrovirus-related Pol polyprotein from type-1 retrotransposable element R2 n=1 Tax=Eumeta variegata TaxID=151549 RepID=A0A4C1V2R8_EUMVA|nr:Retrovirus-related Pol polyprotein from type-1 retrotransposable element R2 [Eumeta japonica]
MEEENSIKIENQEQRLNQLERQTRQRNVVFFGIEENERSYSHLENNLIDFLEKYFSLNINCHDLEAARRIGKKTDKPRPIAVTFATLGSKIKVMQQKKALNDTDYYLKDDYPYHVLQKRKMLQEQVKIELEKGNKAIIKYDKLVVLKHNKTDADHTDNRKRVKLETTGPTFPVERGVRQGDPLSPRIFIAILETALGELDWSKKGLYIKGKYLSHLRFADDLVLFSESSSQLQVMIEDLCKTSRQAPKRNRSARHEPVCMPISLTLSLALSLSLLGGLTVLEWKGRVPFTLCLSLSLLGGLMPEWKGRVPLTRSHCERIT